MENDRMENVNRMERESITSRKNKYRRCVKRRLASFPTLALADGFFGKLFHSKIKLNKSSVVIKT